MVVFRADIGTAELGACLLCVMFLTVVIKSVGIDVSTITIISSFPCYVIIVITVGLDVTLTVYNNCPVDR